MCLRLLTNLTLKGQELVTNINQTLHTYIEVYLLIVRLYLSLMYPIYIPPFAPCDFTIELKTQSTFVFCYC